MGSDRATGFAEAYADATDPNDRYRILREEMARLREGAEWPDDVFDPEAVQGTLRDLSEGVEGHLLVLVANDFGQPMSFRPEGVGRERVDDLRQAILAGKYDDEHPDLAAIRTEVLDAHPRIHKTIVAELPDADGTEAAEDTRARVRYHLPEGTNGGTNFLTVREMVGLVDYTTNSAQAEGLSVTY